ncbi:hypothetical protein EYC80_004136 [Monilinia laxa]|uniref:Uncharacterized protein n=1 Tax=Monilinia laxa TaxID=61186 RepID=A0A5N6KME3_MONLA|nr:hypothetical protein EYC80_004136 [Monilinia laxa]
MRSEARCKPKPAKSKKMSIYTYTHTHLSTYIHKLNTINPLNQIPSSISFITIYLPIYLPTYTSLTPHAHTAHTLSTIFYNIIVSISSISFADQSNIKRNRPSHFRTFTISHCIIPWMLATFPFSPSISYIQSHSLFTALYLQAQPS